MAELRVRLNLALLVPLVVVVVEGRSKEESHENVVVSKYLVKEEVVAQSLDLELEEGLRFWRPRRAVAPRISSQSLQAHNQIQLGSLVV